MSHILLTKMSVRCGGAEASALIGRTKMQCRLAHPGRAYPRIDKVHERHHQQQEDGAV
jgi:hypothetical protein